MNEETRSKIMAETEILGFVINYATEKKANWTKSDRRILPDIPPPPFEYKRVSKVLKQIFLHYDK
ncbi:hypothetical protein NKR74_23595 [Bacillus sp. 3103sda1]|uniref:hypothetical protein n=1 Tax=Bacillus sp. 3103sda1 TaxID=2953808 RepID=UPI00209D3163|nr:hypothetical protein [Bacillus sp. 3103sda1]MCP1126248.1 hypothetical protein [Bacillus sp. 3103sda1]